MGRIIGLITGRGPELTADTTYLDLVEQRAKERGSVLINAYFQGKDPGTEHELSKELRDAIGPFAMQAIVDQAAKRIQERNEAIERLRR